MNAGHACAIIPYSAQHLEDVSLIDRLCFIDPWLKRSFIEELSAGHALSLVAVAHDTSCVLGFCLSRIIADECTINRFAVHPDYQRRGIATHMLRTLLHRAGCQGAVHCIIDVRAGNTAARRLYAGHGFKQIGIRKAYYQIGNEDAIVMQCKIKHINRNTSLKPE